MTRRRLSRKPAREALDHFRSDLMTADVQVLKDETRAALQAGQTPRGRIKRRNASRMDANMVGPNGIIRDSSDSPEIIRAFESIYQDASDMIHSAPIDLMRVYGSDAEGAAGRRIRVNREIDGLRAINVAVASFRPSPKAFARFIDCDIEAIMSRLADSHQE